MKILEKTPSPPDAPSPRERSEQLEGGAPSEPAAGGSFLASPGPGASDKTGVCGRREGEERGSLREHTPVLSPPAWSDRGMGWDASQGTGDEARQPGARFGAQPSPHGASRGRRGPIRSAETGCCGQAPSRH